EGARRVLGPGRRGRGRGHPPRGVRLRLSETGSFLATTTFPPLSVHSFSVLVGTQPWPLQPFCPPHPWPPPAQEPVPLQELIPAHLTSPPALSWPAALSAAWAAVADIARTAEAMGAPFGSF